LPNKRKKKKKPLPLMLLLVLFLFAGGITAFYYPGVVSNIGNFFSLDFVSEPVEKEQEEEEKPLEERETIEDPFAEVEEEKEVPADAEEEDTTREKPEEEEAIEEAPAETGDEEEDYKVISDGDYLLALVTKETTLKSDYVPADLKPLPDHLKTSEEMYLRAEALEHLKKMAEAAAEDGVTLKVASAYRSYDTQKYIFEDYASRHGKDEANRFSARPGQSEHQLGTTADFGGTAVDFSAEFASTDQGHWLAENAHYYGFALSYPEGKEDITGYIYEPWHYRYIGVDEAIKWKESGLTLKEYLEQQPQEFE